MKLNIAKNIKNQVKSSRIDDPWATCDSTSHPGLKFYVNQRTGIKVWNITASEIEFAEKADKGGPEPQKYPTMNHSKIEKICNKQIINNQFTNQLSNLLVNNVPVCSFNVWENPLNQTQQLQPQQSYTLVPTAVAEAYQRLLPCNTLQNASVPMAFNTNPNPLQNVTLPIGYNNSQNAGLPVSYNINPSTSQNTCPPMRNNINSSEQNHPRSGLAKSGKYRYTKWARSQGHNTFDQNRTQVDLRRKLVRQKSLNETYKGNNVIDNETNKRVENKRNEPNWENTSVQMSLASLKLLTSSGSNPCHWYIVVDTDVILKNYTYINNMATADPDCHLVVPHHVILELQSHVSKSSNVQPRRILRFLTQQIESGLVLLGDKVTDETSSRMTITTCANLASQDTQVILITSDTEVFKYTMLAKNVHIYTMQKIKDILAKRPVKIYRANSPTLAIKIVVPNNAEKSNATEHEAFESPFTFDATKRANDPRDISVTPFQKRVDSNVHKFAGDSGIANRVIFYSTNETRDTRTPPQHSFDSNECDNDRDILETSRIIDDSTELSNDQDIYETTCNRNIDSNTAIDAYNVSNITPSQTTRDSTTLGNDSRDFPRTSRRIFGSTEPNNYTRNISDSKTLSHKTFDLSEPASHGRNIPKYATPAKNLSRTNVCTKKTENQFAEKSEAVCYRSPTKSVPETGKDVSNTGGFTKNDESEKRSPCLDLTSPDSLTSGHVSLDTIRMKKIISMKRLTNVSHKLQPESARSITADKIQTSAKSVEYMPRATHSMPYRPSVSRSINFVNDNKTEESVVKTKNVVAKNVILEETSTGVINDSSQNDVKKVTKRSIFMHEVVGQSMEDVLKTRLDEWLFRFVQIMEEVLRVKLQEKVPYDDKEYPAPRDLQEATTCIINKYIKNFNIVNAANNLSFILYKAGDENGKIADNIQPSDYMEMYSYGVYLVETFQDMNAECKVKDCKIDKTSRRIEDKADSCSCYEVNAASESLKKLLYDIHNANQETFVDNPHDLSTEIQNSDPYDFEIDTREESLQDLEALQNVYYDEHEAAIMQTPCEVSPNSYNLRPQKLKSQSTDDEASLKEATVEKDVESSFFNCLQLQKSIHNNIDKLNTPNTVSINAPEQIQTVDEREKPTLRNLKIHFSKNESNNSTSRSKVVCNFTVNPEIERKMKARLNQKEYDDDDEDDKLVIDENRTENQRKTSKLSLEIKSEAKENFTSYMALIARSFINIFKHVKSLCDEYVNANKQSDVCTVNELHQNLQREYTNIKNVHHALDSIIKREEYNEDKNIQTLLKMTNQGETMIPDDEQCLQYKNLIAKCKKTTEDYLVTVRRILKMDRG